MRIILRNKRKALAKSLQYKASIKLLHNLLKNNILYNKNIAIYIANDGEIATDKIIYFLQKNACNVYLPVLNKEKLKFAKIGKTYSLNKFGIKEPIKTKILTAKQINLILLPLVGFDKNCNRIGMGGGFYDKTLSFKLKQKKYQQPKLYGLAYDFQKTKIDSNSWDIQLNKVITNL